METENLWEYSLKKLEAKNADMIAANDLTQESAGFGTDTNVLTLFTHDGAEVLELQSKESAAHVILDKLAAMRAKKVLPGAGK
jgi:phosphopantothenoylcysteine decarboxylase/phosphopantothenate--cysteine ligase